MNWVASRVKFTYPCNLVEERNITAKNDTLLAVPNILWLQSFLDTKFLSLKVV